MKKLATLVLSALTLTACTPTAPEKHRPLRNPDDSVAQPRALSQSVARAE